MSNNLIESSKDISLKIAKKFQEIRKEQNITQKDLSLRSGISYASIKRFEQTGEISFVSLLDLARIINRLDDFNDLFKKITEYKNIDEVIESWKK